MLKTVIATGLFVAAGIVGFSSQTAYAAETESQQQNQEQQVVIEVQKGDSLSKIAKPHQTTYQRLFYANEWIENPDVIHPGEKIRIPSADEQLTERAIPDSVIKSSKNSSVGNQNSTKKLSKSHPTATPTSSVDGGVWDKLAACESGGNWSINTGNGYYGGVQFSAATWRAVGGTGLPHQNSKAEQINRAQILQARSGWGQWPACSAKLGLR